MPTIPVLSSLTTLLGGAVTDTFKQLFKPAFLVAAAIFLALNFVLVFPPLRDGGVGVFVTLDALTPTWQIALGTLALFSLAYVLNTLGEFAVTLASGTLIRNSWLGSKARARQGRLFTSLGADLKKYNEELKNSPPSDNREDLKEKAAEAAYRLSFEFPEDERALAPTRLGNILASTASYTSYQYGAHLDALWPTMSLTVKEKNPDLYAQLHNSRDGLTFLAVLLLLLNVVAVEVIAISLLPGPTWLFLWSLPIVIGSLLVYEAAIQKAGAWSRDIRTTFDLYLDEVRDKLGLLPVANLADRKVRWEQVAQWLAYGALQQLKEYDRLTAPTQKPEWYAAPVGKKITAIAPETVQVTERQVEVKRWAIEENSPTARTIRYTHIEYVYAITNKVTGTNAVDAEGVFLIVSDERAPSVPSQVNGILDGQSILSERLPAKEGQTEGLLWPIGDVPAGRSRILKYSLGYEMKISVTAGAAEIEELEQDEAHREMIGITLKYTGTTPGNISMSTTLKSCRQMPEEVYVGGGASVPATCQNDTASWTITGINPGSTVFVNYMLQSI